MGGVVHQPFTMYHPPMPVSHAPTLPARNLPSSGRAISSEAADERCALPAGPLPGRVPVYRGGADTPGFTVRTLPLPPAVPCRAETLRAAARQKYWRTREQRRRDELQRHPARPRSRSTGKSGRVSAGVPPGASPGVSASVPGTPAETRPPARLTGQVSGGTGQPAGGPDSWDKP